MKVDHLSELISASEIKKLAQEGWRIVDVRAPIEFQDGHAPASINLPILNNQERAEIGTAYKLHGREHAIELGTGLISGSLKASRVQLWCEQLLKHENSLITCFRGGLRSRFAQSWCEENQVRRPRLKEGYKGLRAEVRKVLDQFVETEKFWIIAGGTGAGKSEMLRALKNQRPLLDLEAQAEHKGSAFGGEPAEQPAQATFENRIAWDILKENQEGTWLIEDESRLIGRLVQPENFFVKLRASPLIFIDESVENRVMRIRAEYVEEPLKRGESQQQLFEKFRNSTLKIEKRLGGVRAQEILGDLTRAQFGSPLATDWIEKLLLWYYDPLYFDSLRRRDPEILFRGSFSEVQSYLLETKERRP